MLGELPILCAVVFLAPSLHALDDEVIDGMEIRLTGMIGSPQEAPKIPQFKESLTPLLAAKLRRSSSVCRATLLLFATAALVTAQSPYASTIFFDVTEGSDIDANNLDLQTVSGVKTCGARTADVNIDNAPGPSWLFLGSTAVCTTPARIKVLVDPAGLAPGQYLAGIMATIGTDTSS